ncbi:MAG: NADH-quinone oxidoreductase subunit H [Armatimonadota bacterium]|nr:MAG: NADH-quinone oxidoreductase subunit H [Armatimonadota bacterium]
MAHAVLVGIFQILLVLLLSPLLEGVIRKLKARIHSRQGPPITQPYLDLIKLLGKEDLRPTGGLVFRLAPIVTMAAVLMIALLIPMGAGAPIGQSADLIVLLYVMSIAAVGIIAAGFASGSPYASLGAGREMMMVLTTEPVVAVALIVAALKSGTLMLDGMVGWQLSHPWPLTDPVGLSMLVAGVTFFLALQAQVGKLPFDIAEADQEIMGGPFVELSGPRLALIKWCFHMRLLLFSVLLVQIFVPWPDLGLAALNVVMTLVKAFVVVVLVGLIDVVNPRLRIDQSMSYFARIIVVALVAVALTVIKA